MIHTLKHFPFSRFPETVSLERLEGKGAAGQRLSLAFSIQSAEPVETVSAHISELRGPSSAIPRTAAELYVVKLGEQAGLGVYRAEPQSRPEFLVKDDRVPIRDGYVRKFKHWRHFLRPRYFYRAPKLRAEGPAETSLAPDRPKQIWLDLALPPGTEPGTYRGNIELNADRFTAFLPVEIEVYPFALAEANQDLFLWYKGSLDWRFPQHYVTEQEMRSQLADIHAHGFRSVSLSERTRALAQKAIDIAEEVGFDRHLVIMPPFAEDFDQLKFRKATPLFYVSDEMDAHLPASISYHERWWKAAKRYGRRTMCSLLSKSFLARLENPADIGCNPEVVSLYLPENREAFFVHSLFAEARRERSYFYWMTHMEKPNLHRALAGVYLWKSKAEGIAPYCYQHRPKSPASAFNDFEDWEPGFHLGEEKRPFRHHLTTYPGESQSVPTVQWKGLSEGIWDLRYLTTITKALNEARSRKAAPAIVGNIEKRIETFLSRIDLRSVDILSESQSEPYPGIQPEEYQAFRDQLAVDLLALTEILSRRAA